MNIRRISITFILFALFLILCSHELFLKTDSYFFEEERQGELYLFNGTFDKSENVITRDRIIDPQIVGPEYTFRPSAEDYYDKGAVTYLKLKTGKTGTYVAGISTKPRAIELSGEKFTAYLEHEGLAEVRADREAKGITDQVAHEQYAKHVKAILQVGESRSDHFSAVLGYPIEFIPLTNPYKLAVGDTMSFKLLYLGKPLGKQTVHISSRMSSQSTDPTERALRTDAEGTVRFPIENKGQWYIATIHMLESEEADFDYESQWATLTFEVK
ncbi:MAG: DUF4198 domain-containing protein [Bacteroidota bacterium]